MPDNLDTEKMHCN